jgi:CRP-like cAMP-binding protein
MMRAVPRDRSLGSTIDAAELQTLPNFQAFSIAEVAQMLALATRCDLPKGRLLFREGELGDSCFILVQGQVDVSIKVRGQRHLLSQLSPGTIFGQVGLIAGEARTASCSIRRDAVLAQLDRRACEALLGTQGPVALKFLAALNRGLTDALRTADRRLMQLKIEGLETWDGNTPIAT